MGKKMADINRIESNAKLSRAVIYNGLVFLCGQTADDRSQDIGHQCRQALDKVDAYLSKAGTDKSRLLSAQIWLKNVDRDFAAMNEIWSAWLPSGCAPARATAQCEMAAPDLLVEIIVVAAAA
jgi:enamine deaminase RidA (YjgF/YER057c/UK114 family)